MRQRENHSQHLVVVVLSQIKHLFFFNLPADHQTICIINKVSLHQITSTALKASQGINKR